MTFLLKHLELSGAPFNSSAIQCHPCPETTAGGFSPDHGILLCQNRFFSKRHMEDTLSHELIHAYDHARFDINWQNLRHHACSEVSRMRAKRVEVYADDLDQSRELVWRLPMA